MIAIRMAALGFVAVLGLVAAGAAGAQELRPVGQIEFEPEPAAVEKGVIQIRSGEQRIRSFRIEADEGSADVRSFTVTYADGEQERVRVRQVLKEGERTALYRLEEPRPVKSVEIAYIPKGPVTLVLLADARSAPVAEWKELGCKSVGFLIDRDRIQLDTPDRYKALRLRSIGYDIRLEEMSVRFGNGATDRYVVRTTIPSNGRTGQIDLRGEARRIREIEFLYSSGVISNKKTRLCVDGLVANIDED
jgi:hypothetical protein